ncbi:MAG: spore coat associated protein CotJA [Oscillospiraceae bacterium]|nr:spore coat associated protein CotJA [Oscillospiraceae bacterium]
MTPAQVFPDVTPPGMAYVPYQLWSENIYDAQTGIQQGTLFPVLDLPFSPAGGDCS